jgi:uncharacterized protein (DUF2147 family)
LKETRKLLIILKSLRLLLLYVLFAAGGVAAADPAVAGDPADAIVGDWLVQSRDAVVRIARTDDGYEGRIVWQLRDHYGPEDGPDWDGKVAVDRYNPDPALRSRTIDGLRLIWGLNYRPEDGEWNGGHVYDADDGRTYRCRIRLRDPDHLKLRAYVGITLLGGSTTWTRVGSFPAKAPAVASVLK